MPDPVRRPENCRLLVIGCGNELRSDDGVGPRVAAAVDQLQLPGVQAILCHQLTPELADPLSRADRVVFVDATVEPVPAVQLRQLNPDASDQPLAHTVDPRTLLALARELFGRAPLAWELIIPVENLEFGDSLSRLASEGMRLAVERVRALALEKDTAPAKD